MPTYGYRCTKCSTEFDVWERMADPPKGRCPACGAKGKRLFFPAGIVFKGSGFYKTDSRTSDGGSAAHRASQASAAEPKEKPDQSSSGSESQKAGSGDTSATPAADGGKPTADGGKPASMPAKEPPKHRPSR